MPGGGAGKAVSEWVVGVSETYKQLPLNVATNSYSHHNGHYSIQYSVVEKVTLCSQLSTNSPNTQCPSRLPIGFKAVKEDTNQRGTKSKNIRVFEQVRGCMASPSAWSLRSIH